MIVSLIVAHGRRREIGFKNKLCWKLKTDLLRFKTLTMNHPIIMGRKTFESLPKLLPGRVHLVVTRNQAYQAPGAQVFHRLHDAINWARQKNYSEAFIIGGAEIYNQSLEIAQRLHVTEVNYLGPADAYFPAYQHLGFKLVKEELVKESKKDQFESHYKIYQR